MSYGKMIYEMMDDEIDFDLTEYDDLSIDLLPACEYPTTFLGKYHMAGGMKPSFLCVETEIEWLVLKIDREERKALLLSKYSLDWEPYMLVNPDERELPVTWDASLVREYLNGEFLQKSFTEEERSCILDTYIPPAPVNGTAVLDKMFLLSEEEIRTYFKRPGSAVTVQRLSDSILLERALRTEKWDRIAEWKSKGNRESMPWIEISHERYPGWWTRTQGEDAALVKCVDGFGRLIERDADEDEWGIRPAMWIRL